MSREFPNNLASGQTVNKPNGEVAATNCQASPVENVSRAQLLDLIAKLTREVTFTGDVRFDKRRLLMGSEIRNLISIFTRVFPDSSYVDKQVVTKLHTLSWNIAQTFNHVFPETPLNITDQSLAIFLERPPGTVITAKEVIIKLEAFARRYEDDHIHALLYFIVNELNLENPDEIKLRSWLEALKQYGQAYISTANLHDYDGRCQYSNSPSSPRCQRIKELAAKNVLFLIGGQTDYTGSILKLTSCDDMARFLQAFLEDEGIFAKKTST